MFFGIVLVSVNNWIGYFKINNFKHLVYRHRLFRFIKVIFLYAFCVYLFFNAFQFYICTLVIYKSKRNIIFSFFFFLYSKLQIIIIQRLFVRSTSSACHLINKPRSIFYFSVLFFCLFRQILFFVIKEKKYRIYIIFTKIHLYFIAYRNNFNFERHTDGRYYHFVARIHDVISYTYYIRRGQFSHKVKCKVTSILQRPKKSFAVYEL